MDAVNVKSQKVDSEVSVSGQVVKVEPEKDQVPSIFVDMDYGGTNHGFVEVKLFGEELKQLLEGHTFFFRHEEVDDDDNRVRRISIDMT
jgi:hypothetical protein